MKKALLGTSALVAASVLAAGPATAAEPLKLGLGGYMEQSIGIIDHDGDASTQAGVGRGTGRGFDIFEETEVFFKGSTTLDNGIKVAVDIQLEGLSGGTVSTGDYIDEAYITLTSPTMGQVVFGSENMPNYKMHYGAPTVSRQNIDSSDYDGFWSPNLTGHSFVNSAFGNTSGRFFANDPQQISYYTPRFAGFQAGIGWASDTGQGNTKASTGLEDGISVGLNYRGDFDGVGLNASFGWMYWGDDTVANAAVRPNQNPMQFQGGLNVTFSGFAVGASYSTINTTGAATSASAAAVNSLDSWTLNVGASYKTGPYGVSLNYQMAEAEGSQTAALSGDDELDRWEIAGTYNLGPGINWHAAVAYKDEEGEAVGNADDLESWIGVTGIVISF